MAPRQPGPLPGNPGHRDASIGSLGKSPLPCNRATLIRVNNTPDKPPRSRFRALAGAGCRRIFARDGSCPDGPGHGAASGPGYCRGPVAKRRGTMGRYLRAMAGPDSPQAPAGGGAGYWPLPCPARTWKPRRWAAICGPRPGPAAPTRPAGQGAGYLAAPWPSAGPAPATRPDLVMLRPGPLLPRSSGPR